MTTSSYLLMIGIRGVYHIRSMYMYASPLIDLTTIAPLSRQTNTYTTLTVVESDCCWTTHVFSLTLSPPTNQPTTG